MNKRNRTLDFVISIFFFCAIWHLYIVKAEIPRFLLPTPSVVVEEFFNQILLKEIWYHLAITGIETLLGFLIAIVIGMLIGYFIHKNETIRISVLPFLIFFQAAPKIALVPLFIIWFGLGYLSKIILVFSMAFFPIVAGMMDGLNAVPRDISDYLSLLDATRKQRLFKIELIYALPTLFASAKVGIVQALIGAIVAEWMSGQSGLGYLQTFATATFNTPLLMTTIILTVIVGLLFYGAIDWIQNRLLSWKEPA
ncbi:ABC transporter permease [Enterococcus sp. JM9B]|uniref:ABC transporter permease n=1 Tax=Enterococcus sp. JM9B TaxID=1857216 RepID=UPI001374B188|nr:ABC transporter permease [Enterococcus sp. JM9B]KAF1303515.1 ABC transporter permease [Enterococcus sp. JM9B]